MLLLMTDQYHVINGAKFTLCWRLKELGSLAFPVVDLCYQTIVLPSPGLSCEIAALTLCLQGST
jgi:hypothetical protein